MMWRVLLIKHLWVRRVLLMHRMLVRELLLHRRMRWHKTRSVHWWWILLMLRMESKLLLLLLKVWNLLLSIRQPRRCSVIVLSSIHL